MSSQTDVEAELAALKAGSSDQQGALESGDATPAAEESAKQTHEEGSA
jgi:hypothetical protein